MAVEIAGFLFASEEEYLEWDNWTDAHTGNSHRDRFVRKYGNEVAYDGNTIWCAAINHHYKELFKKIENRRRREERRRTIAMVGEYLERSDE